MTKQVHSTGERSVIAPPVTTGTREPSLRRNSFSNGRMMPVSRSSSSARASASAYSGGVIPAREIAPESISARDQPISSRKASFASTMRSGVATSIPITPDSESARMRASLSRSAATRRSRSSSVRMRALTSSTVAPTQATRPRGPRTGKMLP